MWLVPNSSTLMSNGFHKRTIDLNVLRQYENIVPHYKMSAVGPESPENISVNIWLPGPDNCVIKDKDIFHRTASNELVGIVAEVISYDDAIHCSSGKLEKSMIVN